MFQRYLFIAFLGGIGGYMLGLTSGAQLTLDVIAEAPYGS